MSNSSKPRHSFRSTREKKEWLYDGVQPLSKSKEKGKYCRKPRTGRQAENEEFNIDDGRY